MKQESSEQWYIDSIRASIVKKLEQNEHSESIVQLYLNEAINNLKKWYGVEAESLTLIEKSALKRSIEQSMVSNVPVLQNALQKFDAGDYKGALGAQLDLLKPGEEAMYQFLAFYGFPLDAIDWKNDKEMTAYMQHIKQNLPVVRDAAHTP